MRALLVLFASVILFGGCATTPSDVASSDIDVLWEYHIPRLEYDNPSWGVARLLADDITLSVLSGRCTWEDLGITQQWLNQQVDLARMRDIARARIELANLREGAVDFDTAFHIRGPVLAGLCTWEHLGVTAEEQKLIEELLSPPDQVAGN